MTERFLFDRVPISAISTILKHRFDQRISIEAIKKFREGFWDTVSLSKLDFVNYFKMSGRTVRKSNEGSLTERPLIQAWEEGVHPDEEQLNVDEMMRSVTVDSFMQFKKAQSTATPSAANEARGWATTLMGAAKACKSSALAGALSKAASVKPLLEYSNSNAPSLDDLHRENAETNLGTGHILDEIEGEKKPTETA